jgi:pimeloyl-ACP methyl ester carboxylesterase
MPKQKLIILPGWGGNEELWQHQCRYLADIAESKVIVVMDRDTIDQMADAVLAQMPDQVVLVGHSMGGWLAQHIAIKAPARVLKLILLATWTGASPPTLISTFKSFLKRIENGEQEKLFDEIRPTIVHPERINDRQLMNIIKESQKKFPKEGLIHQTKVEINGGDTTPLLHLIRASTLVIHARQDAFFSLEEHEKIARKIPHATLTIIENCGHMPQVEKPEAVTALMRLWIQL